MKIFNILSTLFGNKDFISRESPIFADFKNVVLYKKICIIHFGMKDFVDLYLKNKNRKIKKVLCEPGMKVAS